MLDFRSIITDVGCLAAETSRRADERKSQIEIALQMASLDDECWKTEHASRIEHASTRWLTARPLSSNSLASASADPPATAPRVYTAIAIDGSQIPLDRHEIATCYVLNAGKVAIHYGSGDRPILSSAATLHYKDEDIMLAARESGDDAGNSFVTDRELATRRFLCEMDALSKLLDDCAGRENAVAFVDGPLVLWTLEAEGEERRAEVLRKLLDVLDQASRVNIPIVGYLSRPASREVIGAMRVALCPEPIVECKRCPYKHLPALPCSPIDRLCDADLFRVLLAPGKRSGVFRSRSLVLRSYKPDGNKIAFFYLNTGSEIARLELPLWAAENPALLDLCHVVALDQTRKGMGYPICLTEAHEQAVVSNADRDAFFRIVQRELVKADIPAMRTAKAVSKRRPVV
jgi:hypothetical protein